MRPWRSAALWNHANASVYMVIHKKMGMPIGIARKGNNQLEIALVTVIIEEAVRTTIGGSCARSWTNCGQDGG